MSSSLFENYDIAPHFFDEAFTSSKKQHIQYEKLFEELKNYSFNDI
ncbi:MAG: hypothetical protein RL060_1601, partial [Bacteroidota bacterium]